MSLESGTKIKENQKSMGIDSLNTQGIQDSHMAFQTAINEFANLRSEMDQVTNELMATWHGKGANSFARQYELLANQLKDINGSLRDIYDAMVGAETAYIEADDEIARKISGAGA